MPRQQMPPPADPLGEPQRVGTELELARVKSRSLEVLTSLNEIAAAVSRLTPRGHTDVRAVLRLIADSAVKSTPGATAAIYTYDAAEQTLNPGSLVSAGALGAPQLGDPPGQPDGDRPDDPAQYAPPRPDGVGMRAIRQRRRVLSYEEPDLQIHPIATRLGATAVACAPLIVANDPVGVMYLYLLEARRFDEFELSALDNLAHHAAMALYQAHRLSDVQRDLEHTEAALNRLWRAGMLISSRLGLDETLEAILEMALDVTGAHHGIFRLVSEERRELVTQAVAGAPGRPQLDALPIDGTSIMGWVAVHRQPLCIHDLEAAPWVRLYHPLDADLRMRSELAVPLVGSSGRLEGVLNLESPEIGAFSDHDRHLLQSLATQAVVAIQEARLLDAVLDVARLLLIEPHERVLEHLVYEATDLLNASASAIWALEGETLILLATTEGWQRADHLPLRESLTGEAVLNKAPVTSEDVRRDKRFYRHDLAEAQAWTRALIVPLLSAQPLGSDGRKAIGAFSVYGVHGAPGRFTESEWDKKVLTCLAHYASLALQSAEHQRALRRAQERHAVAETFAAVGDVAANVLHHLNNKVGTIPVRVQGIQEKSREALSRDDYLAANLVEIERSAREALDAVRDSLTYLRPIHASPVTIVGCVAAALDDVHLPEGVRVEQGELDGLPPVVASQRSLVFVFTNLLENAAIAMQGQGTIKIDGRVIPSGVEVTVADDGPGIPAELHARIFEFGLPSTAAARDGQLGFGLWWVKSLLMRLGGSVDVESDGVHGTTFRLRLPQAEVAGV
ncbi:MAG: GAF domain-containing protein [Anaerolineae bacterium]